MMAEAKPITYKRNSNAYNRVIFFDCSSNTSGLWQGYDAEVLEKVSGSFRGTLTANTELTFTFKMAGNVKFGAATAAAQTMTLNGTSVWNQEVEVHIGDTFYVKNSVYNYPVVILEPHVTTS